MPKPSKKPPNPTTSRKAATRKSGVTKSSTTTFKSPPPLKRLDMTFTMLNAIHKPSISDYSRFTSFEDPMKALYENAVLPTPETLDSSAGNSNSAVDENLDPWHQHYREGMEPDEDLVYETTTTTTSSDSEDVGKVRIEDCVDPSWPDLTWKQAIIDEESRRFKVPRTPQLYNPPGWYRNWGYQIPKKSRGKSNLPKPTTSSPASQQATSTPYPKKRRPFKAKTMDCLKIQPAVVSRYPLNSVTNQMKGTKIPYRQRPVQPAPLNFEYASHPNHNQKNTGFYHHQNRNTNVSYGASHAPLSSAPPFLV